MEKLSIRELNDIIRGIAINAYRGYESQNDDELCDRAHEELDKRIADRGEMVRLSNAQKTMFSKRSYVCGYLVDGEIAKSFYVHNEAEAKALRRIKWE